MISLERKKAFVFVAGAFVLLFGILAISFSVAISRQNNEIEALKDLVHNIQSKRGSEAETRNVDTYKLARDVNEIRDGLLEMANSTLDLQVLSVIRNVRETNMGAIYSVGNYTPSMCSYSNGWSWCPIEFTHVVQEGIRFNNPETPYYQLRCNTTGVFQVGAFCEKTGATPHLIIQKYSQGQQACVDAGAGDVNVWTPIGESIIGPRFYKESNLATQEDEYYAVCVVVEEQDPFFEKCEVAFGAMGYIGRSMPDFYALVTQ